MARDSHSGFFKGDLQLTLEQSNEHQAESSFSFSNSAVSVVESLIVELFDSTTAPASLSLFLSHTQTEIEADAILCCTATALCF